MLLLLLRRHLNRHLPPLLCVLVNLLCVRQALLPVLQVHLLRLVHPLGLLLRLGLGLLLRLLLRLCVLQ